MSLNKAMLIGRLTRDPEMRYSQGGQPVTNARLATNRVIVRQDGTQREDTEFHDVVLFGRQAETVAQYSRKGAEVYVEGRLQTREWEGQDGQKRRRTEVVGERVQFLRTPERSAERSQEQVTEHVAESLEQTGPVLDEQASERGGRLVGPQQQPEMEAERA